MSTTTSAAPSDFPWNTLTPPGTKGWKVFVMSSGLVKTGGSVGTEKAADRPAAAATTSAASAGRRDGTKLCRVRMADSGGQEWGETRRHRATRSNGVATIGRDAPPE